MYITEVVSGFIQLSHLAGMYTDTLYRLATLSRILLYLDPDIMDLLYHGLLNSSCTHTDSIDSL